jgi:hypothetical protein
MNRVFLRTLIGLILLIAVGMADLWAGTKIWPTVIPFAIVATVSWVLFGPSLSHGWTGWRSGSEPRDFWTKSSDGYFMHHHRKNWEKGSQKKLCFVATNQELLADVLEELASRPDCVYVKYSLYQKDGMYLGRCFLVDDHQVGLVWAQFKNHRCLFCSVQDDDFTAPYRRS